MPIYEYRCAACGHELEALQKVSDGPLRKCPDCGKQKLERLMSAPSFRLKGSGWYETDFKSDGEKKRNLVENGERAEKSDAAVEATAKKDEAKSATPEAKPAAPANGAGADKTKPAAKKPAAAPRKKASTKASRSASA
ncbi:MAG TPA: zinc ribbon domain-containing protein [Gammaproteobacteria bacterium]|nr:zinc ribbon domain-containing protein [Gammaproteobacteria bacterium]